MQLSSKEHFQLIVFQKLWDWRLEKPCVGNRACLVDHHQRSHYDTITIGPEGMMNWALQLNNSQSVKLFDSLVEKFNMQRSPNQPNQNPNQSVIDRGNLITQKMCLQLKVKRPVPTRSMKKVCTKNLVLQIDRWNLINCLKTPVLSKLTMEQGNLLSETAQMHTVKEQFALEENRDIAFFNTDNEFNRAINEENIDFKIPGLSHSAVKQSHGVNVFRRSRTTLIDMHFKVIFNNVDNSILSANNHKTWLKQLETSNCVNDSMWNPKHSAKYVCRIGTSASSIARAGTSCEMERRRTRNSSSTLLTSFRFPITTSRKSDPAGTATGRSRGITSTSSRIRSRRNTGRNISWVFTTGSSVMRSSARTWLNWVAVKKNVVRWTNWRTRITRTTSLHMKFECIETIGGSVRILLVPTRCPWGIELISKKHCLPCDTSRTKRIKLITKIGKALPHLGGTGKILGGILHLGITATMDPALIDRGNLIGPIVRGMILNIDLMQNYSDNSVTVNSSFLSPTGCVKNISPIQENSIINGYDENDDNNMSDETKCETNNCINNKWNNMRNKHFTKHDTNDDVDFDNCVVHTVRWACT